jgi:hypothetical protein
MRVCCLRRPPCISPDATGFFLDGSFVTAKPLPVDYDACWDPAGINPAKLDPVFSDFSNKRQAQKDEVQGGILPLDDGQRAKTAVRGFLSSGSFYGKGQRHSFDCSFR